MQLLQRLPSFLLLQREQFVGYVILVGIRGIGDGLDAETGGGDHFHIVKLHVGIETFLSCFRAQRVNAAQTSVIGSEIEKQFVGVRHWLVREILVHHEADVLYTGMMSPRRWRTARESKFVRSRKQRIRPRRSSSMRLM